MTRSSRSAGKTPTILLPIALLSASLACPPGARSQEPEVRRALPATQGSGSAFTSFINGEVPVAKALPVRTAPTPAPAATPSAMATPQPLPSQQPAQPATSPTPDSQAGRDSDSIRIAPTEARDPAALAAAQLAIADGFFNRKQPEAAVPEYEKFLVMAPRDAAGRERALYRLGEAQRLMGSNAAAENSFSRLLKEYPAGSFAPGASFRTGEYLELRGDFSGAAKAFHQAGTEKPDAATGNSLHTMARYREALALCRTSGREAGEKMLSELAESTGANSYRIPAMLQLGASAAERGNKQQALDWYSKALAAGASGEEFLTAAMKAAVLNSELGNTAEARKLFEKIARSDDSRWGPAASLGALRLAAGEGDNQAVVKLAGEAIASGQNDPQEILLLRATALRKLGKVGAAMADCERIDNDYPGSSWAHQAAFQRLLCLHATRSGNLLPEIDRYLLTASDPADRARAELLKAEETLRLGRYKEAAALYHAIPAESLPPASKADIAYKEAWALTQSDGKREAVSALDRFLKDFPAEERAPSALAQRALLKQQLNDLPGAVADFTLLMEQYPKATARELALQQKALLLGQLQQNKEMSETFALLLRDYPKSPAAPQAHYWIGWTAMENKEYAAAVEELSKARSGDPKQFGERAGLRILLAHYYQNHPAEAAREAAALKPSLIPPEVGRWIGLSAMQSGDSAKAERFLAPLVKEGLPGATDSEIQGTLASALIAQGKFRDALAPSAACLKLASDPASRAKALLVAASIRNSMKNFKEAASLCEEAMLLQPEGPINAEARILGGDILMSQQDPAGAAKAYVTVAVLNDDPVLAPKALRRAVEAYRRAGNPEEARKTAEELRKRFPDAPNVPVSAVPKP